MNTPSWCHTVELEDSDSSWPGLASMVGGVTTTQPSTLSTTVSVRISQTFFPCDVCCAELPLSYLSREYVADLGSLKVLI